MQNHQDNIHELELKIKLDLNWFIAYGIDNESSQERLKIFLDNLQQYTDLNPHHHFCQQLNKIFPNTHDIHQDTRKSIDSIHSHESHQNYILFKEQLKTIESFNKDRIEFTAYINFLNHAYGIRDTANNFNEESEQIEHFEALSLSGLSILILGYQMVNILYHYYSYPQYSYARESIWNEYKYQFMTTGAWLSINISSFMINALEASSNFSQLPVIGFSIECALSYLNLQETIQRNEHEQKVLLEQYLSLIKKQAMEADTILPLFEIWPSLEHEERIAQLKEIYLSTSEIEQQKILLTLILNEQKNHLEETKLFTNFLMSTIILFAFLTVQESIGSSFIHLHISLQLSLILAIALLYTCNVLKGIFVNQIAPKLTEKQVELQDDIYLFHGEIHDTPNESSWNETLMQISYDIAIKFSIPAIACILLTETALSFEIILAIFVGLIISYMSLSKMYQKIHEHEQQPTEEIVEYNHNPL